VAGWQSVANSGQSEYGTLTVSHFNNDSSEAEEQIPKKTKGANRLAVLPGKTANELGGLASD
jgi:hypothetical protein